MEKYEQKIIEDEIRRLETAWENAQERYGQTGSASSERTMTKYRVLIDTLENALTDNRYKSLERSVVAGTEKMREVKELIVRLAQAGRIPADVANLLTNTLIRW